MTVQSFFRQYWKSALLVLCIVYLSLASPSGFEKIPVPTFEGADKIVHFLMYLLLTIVFFVDFRKSRQHLHIFVQCAVFPFLLGGLMEILQWQFTAHRSGDYFDLLADVAGIAAGYLLMKTLIFRKK
jgi:VanZ family protein